MYMLLIAYTCMLQAEKTKETGLCKILYYSYTDTDAAERYLASYLMPSIRSRDILTKVILSSL